MYRLAIDIGGTFTDLVYFDGETKDVFAFKTLSTPKDPSFGVINAIRGSNIAPPSVDFFVHGGTTVINAITERKGAVTALITTRGFRDVLEIMRANRPDMYNLKVKKPSPFVPRKLRFELSERVSFEGDIVEPLNLNELNEILMQCQDNKVEAIAIQFMHSYLYPKHERLCREYITKKLPEVSITISSDISREWREYERASTAVLNAYVQPLVSKYFSNLEVKLKNEGFLSNYAAMQSNGGTTLFNQAKNTPISLVESGPAAGVKGASLIGEMIGKKNVIYFDVGGTTTKCSLIENGTPKITTDYKIEWDKFNPGHSIRVPVIDLVEIGAGGGSVGWFDEGGSLKVGPQSAGADPGPASYGRGGVQPTITDAKLIGGTINPSFFASNQFDLDVSKAEEALSQLGKKMNLSVKDAAASIVRIAESNMINALKLVSIQRGYDPRDFVLVAAGGGGPMHAANVGKELGVSEIIIPLLPGYFSAWGMLSTDLRLDLTNTKLSLLRNELIKDCELIFENLRNEAIIYFESLNYGTHDNIVFELSLDMRYLDQEHTVNVPIKENKLTVQEIISLFEKEHKKTFTFVLRDTEIEVVTFRLSASIINNNLDIKEISDTTSINHTPDMTEPRYYREVTFGEYGSFNTPVYRREDLKVGKKISGPVLIEEDSTVTEVLPSQEITVDKLGLLRISSV